MLGPANNEIVIACAVPVRSVVQLAQPVEKDGRRRVRRKDIPAFRSVGIIEQHQVKRERLIAGSVEWMLQTILQRNVVG